MGYDTHETITVDADREAIEALRQKAAQAGDEVMVHVCWVALGEKEPGQGGQQWPYSQEEAIAECALMIANAQ